MIGRLAVKDLEAPSRIIRASAIGLVMTLSLLTGDCSAAQPTFPYVGHLGSALAAGAIAKSGDFEVTQHSLDAVLLPKIAGSNLLVVAPNPSVARGARLAVFFSTQGCRANAYGHCEVSADIQTIGPNGKVHDQKKSLRVWYDRAPSAAEQTGPGEIYTIAFKLEDPAGPYRIRAVVTDNVAKITVHTEGTATVSAR